MKDRLSLFDKNAGLMLMPVKPPVGMMDVIKPPKLLVIFCPRKLATVMLGSLVNANIVPELVRLPVRDKPCDPSCPKSIATAWLLATLR